MKRVLKYMSMTTPVAKIDVSAHLQSYAGKTTVGSERLQMTVGSGFHVNNGTTVRLQCHIHVSMKKSFSHMFPFICHRSFASNPQGSLACLLT